jgi:Cu/Ag efflux pump CusA
VSHATQNASFNVVEFSTRRRVTVMMATLTLVMFGVIALMGLKVNLLPDLSYPTLTVRTEYTGAAPSEIETLISEPVEEAVGVVKGLRKLKSVSRTGQSDVVLEFAWGTDMDKASLEVRDKMESLSLPLEAKPPVLLRFNPSTAPIMRLVLATKGKDSQAELTRLRRYADDDLKKKLEPVEGVAAVKVGGGLEDEVQVDIDQQKLAQLNLPIDTVIQRLQQENINISGGRLEEGSQRFLVRTVNQFASVEEIREMLVTTQSAGGGNAANAAAEMARVAAATGNAAAMAAASSVESASSGGNTVAGGRPIRLKDIADVRQGYKEREAIIRLGGPRSRRTGDLQGRRRQHGVDCRCDLEADRGHQEADAAGHRTDDDRRPVAVHPQRHQRREEGRRDRRPARDPDHLPVPARWLEHVRRRPVAAGVDHHHVLLHGAVRPEPQRDVAGRPRARHRPRRSTIRSSCSNPSPRHANAASASSTPRSRARAK